MGIRVKAGRLEGAPVRCSMCLETKAVGRFYDFEVALMDPLTGSTVAARGVATICSDCREDFHRADLELDAPAMYEDWRSRHPNEEEAAQDAAREANGWPASPEDLR
jgi:hypothetical protein